jgi:hypothetical protein
MDGTPMRRKNIAVRCGRERASRYSGDTVTVRGYCQLYRRILPDRFPVHPRGEMATYRPPVVARRDGGELVCDSLHDGPHIWPNGDEVDVPDQQPGRRQQ